VTELVVFIEKHWGIEISNNEIVPENFNSVARLAEFVRRKISNQQGLKTFMGLELEWAPGALIPRQETELLGAKAVEILNSRGSNQIAIDMCCGSGNLACGVASAISSLHVWASDLTDSCVQLAQRNVERLGLTSRVFVRSGDLFSGLSGLSLEDKIDVIICNPPYISIPRLAGDRAYLLEHEPREAFDGGVYGLSIFQRVIREAIPFLKPDGWLLFEIGEGQEKQVAQLFRRARAYSEAQFVNDADTPRVAFAQRNN
jgi:HemK-like putative methylase